MPNRLSLILILLLLINFGISQAQSVSITIDDVPNTRLYKANGLKSGLLEKLDSLQIPVAIFINEGGLYKTDEITQNFSLLTEWAKRDYITLGNHSFNHSRYSEVGIDSFQVDIMKGEAITRELAEFYQKPLQFFRFPYNDLGEDSLQHTQVNSFLTAHHYQIAPFTVESSDWLFDYLYAHYLEMNQPEDAQIIGELYLQNTLDYFDYIDSVATAQYGRNIHHIYLCHDNVLNADYMDVLVQALKNKGYSFISLEEAMQDKIYQQEDIYYKKWGISWLYRWMNNPEKRMQLLRKEPEMKDILEEYNKVRELRGGN